MCVRVCVLLQSKVELLCAQCVHLHSCCSGFCTVVPERSGSVFSVCDIDFSVSPLSLPQSTGRGLQLHHSNHVPAEIHPSARSLSNFLDPSQVERSNVRCCTLKHSRAFHNHWKSQFLLKLIVFFFCVRSMTFISMINGLFIGRDDVPGIAHTRQKYKHT